MGSVVEIVSCGKEFQPRSRWVKLCDWVGMQMWSAMIVQWFKRNSEDVIGDGFYKNSQWTIVTSWSWTVSNVYGTYHCHWDNNSNLDGSLNSWNVLSKFASEREVERSAIRAGIRRKVMLVSFMSRITVRVVLCMWRVWSLERYWMKLKGNFFWTKPKHKKDDIVEFVTLFPSFLVQCLRVTCACAFVWAFVASELLETKGSKESSDENNF